MSTQSAQPVVTAYFIAHDERFDVLHTGVIDKGLVVATGQPTLDLFTDEREYLAVLSRYKDVTSAAFKAELAAEVAWVKDVASRQPGPK